MILVLCIKQVDDGRIPDNLAAGKTSVHQGDASSTRELKVHPTHRGNYSLVPSVQIGVWRGPTTVRKTVGNSAANFRHIFTERELGNHHSVVGNVIDLRLEVDAWMVMVEAHAADQRAA